MILASYRHATDQRTVLGGPIRRRPCMEKVGSGHLEEQMLGVRHRLVV
jgi:hypothetical protein